MRWIHLLHTHFSTTSSTGFSQPMYCSARSAVATANWRDFQTISVMRMTRWDASLTWTRTVAWRVSSVRDKWSSNESHKPYSHTFNRPFHMIANPRFTYLTMFDGQFIEVVLNLCEGFDSIEFSSRFFQVYLVSKNLSWETRDFRVTIHSNQLIRQCPCVELW